MFASCVAAWLVGFNSVVVLVVFIVVFPFVWFCCWLLLFNLRGFWWLNALLLLWLVWVVILIVLLFVYYKFAYLLLVFSVLGFCVGGL